MSASVNSSLAQNIAAGIDQAKCSMVQQSNERPSSHDADTGYCRGLYENKTSSIFGECCSFGALEIQNLRMNIITTERDSTGCVFLQCNVAGRGNYTEMESCIKGDQTGSVNGTQRDWNSTTLPSCIWHNDAYRASGAPAVERVGLVKLMVGVLGLSMLIVGGL